MDFMQFVESLFKCTFPMLRKTKGENTGTSTVQEPPPPPKTIAEFRREKIKIMYCLRTSSSYQEDRKRILRRIPFQYENMVAVWCGSDNFPPVEMVENLLYSFGDVKYIHTRWRESERQSQLLWNGVLVEYDEKIEAIRASFDIPVKMMCLRATMLDTVISQMADCELLHPLCHQIHSKVVISRRTPLRHEEVSELHHYLSSFGDIETFFVNNRITNVGVVCEVTYVYLSQAYLAMIMTDGQNFNDNYLMATLEMKEKEKEILRDTKECMFLLTQCFLPK